MSARNPTALTVAGITILTGLLAYAVYFDYKRRNDADFRKKLRKDQKRVQKSVAESQENQATSQDLSDGITRESLKAALNEIRNEVGPRTPEEQESYFMVQIGMGEQLVQGGPLYHLQAAICYFKALRSYPMPVDLIMLYQKTLPEPVFKLVMEMTNLDVSSQEESQLDQLESVPEAEIESTPPPTPVGEHNSEDLDGYDDEGDASPTRSGPPSEASSQTWDKLADSTLGPPPIF